MRAVNCNPADHHSAALVGLSRPSATSVEPDDLQRLLEVDRLVQLFVIETRYVPPTAQRLLALSDLPIALARVALRAQRSCRAWFAWADGAGFRFVVAEMAAVPARNSQQWATRMFFYDEDGRFSSWGTWALKPDGSWMLCER